MLDHEGDHGAIQGLQPVDICLLDRFELVEANLVLALVDVLEMQVPVLDEVLHVVGIPGDAKVAQKGCLICKHMVAESK